MRALILAIGALLVATPAMAQTEHNTGVWATVNAQGPVRGELLGQAEVQARFNDSGVLDQRIFRVGLGRKISDRATLWGGYQYQAVDRPDDVDTTEHRGWQQLNLNLGTALGGKISARTRLEQRFVNTGDGIGWRARQQFRYERPVESVTFVAHTEVFVALNDTDWGAERGFTRVRSFVGINVPVNDVASIEAGYMNQFDERAVDRVDHLVSITLSIKP